MLYDLKIAWRNIRYRPIESAVPLIVVALAIALSITVFALADGAEEGLVRASNPFRTLVIGSAGSGQDLVLSSILLQGTPIGNISYEIYETLQADTDRVQLAVPLAFGDAVGGARIVGTDYNFFDLRPTQLDPSSFQLAEGRLFSLEVTINSDAPDRAEAVLGALAARELGLTIGDRFVGTHGLGVGIAENVHDNLQYTVVGILERSYTAYDAAVYSSLQAVWRVHTDSESSLPSVGQINLVQATAGAPRTDEVTAILVQPASMIGQNQIAQEFYTDPTLQAAFPGDELASLINLLNQGQQILELIGYLVLGIAGLTLFLSMYNAVLVRCKAIAIMRSIGNNRLRIARTIIFETLFISIFGALLGRLIGYGIAFAVAEIYSTQSSIPIAIRFLPNLEAVLWTLSIGVGILAGLLPALMAYRVDVVENLFDM